MASTSKESGPDAAAAAPNYLNTAITAQDIPHETQELLEEYAHIPRDQQLEHILSLRQRAFTLFPYPCIGQFRFLILTLCHHPKYQQLLNTVKDGGVYLDVGLCFGQDLRKLVADGAPSDKTFGLDIDQGLMEIGHDLFRDRDTLKTTLLTRDVFDASADWTPLLGKTDAIHASAFFHLFLYEKQVEIGVLFSRLSRGAGTLIVGRQIGSRKPGNYASVVFESEAYRHDVASLRKMWEEIGQRTGTQWKVEGSMDRVGMEGCGTAADGEPLPHMKDPDSARLLFSIERVA